MTIIFKAKTQEAFIIKILSELLQHNIKTAVFEVTKDGMFLSQMDAPKTILIKVELKSENFSIFKFKGVGKMFIAVNLSHFHKMLRSIKKKDSVQLFVDDKEPNDLGIKVIPKENNRRTTSFIKIQDRQVLDITMPTGYKRPILIPSSEYSKMCKDMLHVGSIVRIEARNYNIRFSCDADGVMRRIVDFGEEVDEESSNDDDSKYLDEKKDYYNEIFEAGQLSRITKLSGLSNSMQIYPKMGLPLLFKSNIGGLGKIEVYIKSKTQIEKESYQISNTDNV